MREPTQAELDDLPADRRLKLLELQRAREDAEVERRRQSRHQWFNSAGILAGVIFTAAGLIATALTLRTAKEGQVTDRYTKAVEQLASDRREVRTAAVYALERIARDSVRDRLAIRDVLAAYIREHDPAASIKSADLPLEPDVDIHAALSVLARRPTGPAAAPSLDLYATRLRGVGIRADTDPPARSCAARIWPARICTMQTLPTRPWAARTCTRHTCGMRT